MAGPKGIWIAAWLSLAFVTGQAVYDAGAQDPSLDGSLFVGQPPPPDPTQPPPRPSWYAQAEAVFLWRRVLEPTNVASLGTPTDIVFTTDDLDKPVKAGGRLLVGYAFEDSPFQVELSYLALAGYKGEAAIRNNTLNKLQTPTEGDLFSPFTGFGNPAVVGVDYENLVSIHEYSALRTGELNALWPVPVRPGQLPTSLLLGVRYLQVRERFDYLSTSLAPTPLGATNSVRTRTGNELWGPQIGAVLHSYLGERTWLDFSAKAGVFNNAASQETTYQNDISGQSTTFQHQHSRDVSAYVADLELTLLHRWTPSLTTRFGYQVMWVDGLALASQNFNQPLDTLRSGPPWLEHNGQVFYHGIHIGAELAW